MQPNVHPSTGMTQSAAEVLLQRAYFGTPVTPARRESIPTVMSMRVTKYLINSSDGNSLAQMIKSIEAPGDDEDEDFTMPNEYPSTSTSSRGANANNRTPSFGDWPSGRSIDYPGAPLLLGPPVSSEVVPCSARPLPSASASNSVNVTVGAPKFETGTATEDDDTVSNVPALKIYTELLANPTADDKTLELGFDAQHEPLRAAWAKNRSMTIEGAAAALAKLEADIAAAAVKAAEQKRQRLASKFKEIKEKKAWELEGIDKMYATTVEEHNKRVQAKAKEREDVFPRRLPDPEDVEPMSELIAYMKNEVEWKDITTPLDLLNDREVSATPTKT
jgi:hypothetical protein